MQKSTIKCAEMNPTGCRPRRYLEFGKANKSALPSLVESGAFLWQSVIRVALKETTVHHIKIADGA